MNTIPKILQVYAGDNFLLYIYFDDGTVRLFDASSVINKGGVFSPLKDTTFFRERLTIINDTVAWDIDGDRNPYTCVDLDPCELYDISQIVEDPLKTAI